MATEIEHKFLVSSDGWRRGVARSTRLRQGYLSVVIERIVRVRLVDDTVGFLTIKGKRVEDRRPEFEYEIPADDARFMLDNLCLHPQLEKTRHHLDLRPGDWTVDEFEGPNAGLVLAEVELADGQDLPELPDWAGLDVTTDDRYSNSSLQQFPFATWPAGTER